MDGDIDWGYGISVNFHKREGPKRANKQQSDPIYLVDSLVYIKPRDKFPSPTPALNYKDDGQLVVLTFSLACILEITSIKISNMPNDINSQSAKAQIIKTMQTVTNKKIVTLAIDTNQP